MTDHENVLNPEVPQEAEPAAAAVEAIPGVDQKKKPTAKKWVIAAVALVLVVVAVILFVAVGMPAIRYSNGVKAFDQGDYAQAAEIFATFTDYKEADTYLAQSKLGIHYTNAGLMMQAGEYDKAISEYKKAGKFLDAGVLLLQAYEMQGDALFDDARYADAAKAYDAAGNQDAVLECGILLVENKKDYETALSVLENHTASEANSYRNYANAMMSMQAKEYQAAAEYFAACSGLLDAKAKKTECVFLNAEYCLHEGYLNKALSLYNSLPDGYTHNGVNAADRITLLNKNTKFLDLVGTWSATDTYFRVQADSTTSSYYYYWYYEDLNTGSIKVTCPYNDDGTFTVRGTATFPSYQNFSSNASDLKIDMESFNFSKVCNKSIPSQIHSSNTAKLTFNGRKFNMQYKYVNDFANVYWHYTYTSKVEYGTRYMLAEDRA